MTVEYIRYHIPGDVRDTFERDYAVAVKALEASDHCLAYELAVCDEDPAEFVLRIEWDSAEGHLRGFRMGPGFKEFFTKVQPYVKAIQEMRHYTPTPLKHDKRSTNGAPE
jgi:quinol monooxygenase YgiN